MTKLKDSRGLPVSTGDARALALFEQAVHETHGYSGNPLETIDAALAVDPDFASAHALRADLAVMSSEKGALPLIAGAAAAFERIGAGATPRERAHVAAAQAWAGGDFDRAIERYGAIVVEHPLDLVALQTAHVMDFFLGDSLMLRDRPAQALPAWSESVPGYGYLLGMHAFGLEETANYARAEDAGRHALDLNAHDPWAVHAVEHVFEMQGRLQDGVRWMQATAPDWKDSALSFHNWWHLALHHLELGDAEQALALYDGPIHRENTPVVLELIDASQMLWRMTLLGVDVGDRWQPLADCWEQAQEGGFYGFNDLHALVAHAGAGRESRVLELLAVIEARAGDADVNGRIAREVVLPFARAIVAFSAGRHARAAALLLPVRSRSARMGGSHAQRDLVYQTCLEAAIRSGQAPLARALASERTEQKPASPVNWQFTARALALAGDAEGAASAREHAKLRRRAQLPRAAA